MQTFWHYGKKFSNLCFAMLLGNVGLLLLLMLAMLPAGFITGSWKRNITISGPPSLDGPAVPWDVHLVHVAAHFFPMIELGTLALSSPALCRAVYRRRRAPQRSLAASGLAGPLRPAHQQ